MKKFAIVGVILLLFLGSASAEYWKVNQVFEGNQNVAGLGIRDDKYLDFGNDNNLRITYDETTNDRAELTMTAGGMYFDVTDITFYTNDATNESLTFSGFVPVFDGGAIFNDEDKLYFGSNSDGWLYYDEATNDRVMYNGSDLRIYDDVEIEFGDGGDGYIRYDETTDDDLEIGCSGGIAIESATVFDSTVGFSGVPTIIDDISLTLGTNSDATIKYDETTDDDLEITCANGIAIESAAVFDSTVGFSGVPKVADDISLTLGDGNDATIKYDETTDDELEITCVNGITLESAVVADSTLDVDGAADFDSTVTFSGVPLVEDDIALTLGTDSDATITYDETTDNMLEIACTGGVAIESAAEFDSTVAFAGVPKVTDDISLTFGADNDATIKYDETTDDDLEITCANGITLESATVFDSTVGFSGVPKVADDIKLTLGGDNDITFEYDENGVDKGVISGAINFANNVDVDGTFDVDGNTDLDLLNVSETLAVVTADYLTVGGVIVPQEMVIVWPISASSVDESIFIASDSWQITHIEEVHTVAGNDGSAVNVTVTNCDGTDAPSAGNNMLQAVIDLKGTANTMQTGTLTATTADLQLADGDRLALDYSGTLTTLAGGSITIHMKRI